MGVHVGPAGPWDISTTLIDVPGGVHRWVLSRLFDRAGRKVGWAAELELAPGHSWPWAQAFGTSSDVLLTNTGSFVVRWSPRRPADPSPMPRLGWRSLLLGRRN